MKATTKKVLFTGFMFALAFSGLTSCKKDEESVFVKQELAKVSEDTISYDGQTLAWGQVNNATKYEVSYDGQEVLVEAANYDVEVEKDVAFSIRAIALDSDPYYTSCTTASSKSFTYKGTIAPELDVTTKTYSWTAVEGARGYRIKENGSIYQGYQQETTYKLVSTADSEGNYYETFQVKADFEEDNYFTVWSKENKITVLSTPEDVTYDGRVLNWKNVNKASSYIIKLYSVDEEGNETVVKEETSSKNSYVFNVFGDSDGEKESSTVVSGSYSVSITSSNDNKDNILDSDEARFSFAYVDPITEISMSNGIISWEPITNADYYVLEVNGEELDEKITTNKYSGFDHSQYASYTIRITPRKYDGSLYSGWSSRFVFTSIESPYLRWESDGQAYTLDWSKKKDGSAYNYANTTFEIIIKEYQTGNIVDQFTTSNPYYYGSQLLEKIGSTKNIIRTVQVKAMKSSEGQNDSDSYLSDPIYFYNLPDPSAYTITTKEVFTDTLETVLYFNDIQINKEFKDYGFEVLYRAGVNTEGGNYNSEDAVKADSVRTITIPANSSVTGYAVDISYKCESVDNKKMLVNENGEKAVFVLSDTVNTIECERLASPTVSLVGTTLQWTAINMASSYQILVEDLTGKQVGDIQFAVGTSFNIANLGLDAGKYNIRVSALGNGNIIFSSLYSNPICITQLATPTNVRVTGNGDSRQIVWDQVEDCSSYQLQIGTHYVTVNDSNEYEIEQSLLSIAGNDVSVTAVGSSANKTLTSASSSVIVLYKLKTPTNVKATDSEINWASVDAYGGKTVGYEVWIGDERISGDDPLTVTHFNYYNYENIKASYDVYNLDVQIKAVLVDSNATQFFASELSSILNVTRLASPLNVTMNQYTGEITWEEGDVDLNTISGYEVKVSYDNHPTLTETYVTTSRSISPVFNERCVGDKVTITVRALGNGVDNVSSNPYNVSTTGKDNMIGCLAEVQKLPVISLDNNPISYTVDDENHIIVNIDEDKIGEVNALGYGIKIDGVLNVVKRYGAGCYELDEESGLYTYVLSKGSTATYNATTHVYQYISRHSSSGEYDIDVKLVGGNYSKNPNVVSDDIICYVDSDYTNSPSRVVILGQFVESDIALQGSTISFLNKANAVGYQYEITYLRMGVDMGLEKITGTLVASNTTNSTLDLGKIPDEATAIHISVKILGDPENDVFSSVKTFETDIVISNVDLTNNG